MKKVAIVLSFFAVTFPFTVCSSEKLIQFIKQGKTKEAQNMLAFDSSNLDVNYKDREGRTPLIHAVLKGNMPIVKFLIEKKANINAQDKAGQAAIHFATLLEKIDIVTLLLKNGANPLIKVMGKLPWQLILTPNLELINILKKAEKEQKIKDEKYVTNLLKPLQKNKRESRKIKKMEFAFQSEVLNTAAKALMMVLNKEDTNKAQEIIDIFKYYDGFKEVLGYLLNYYAFRTRYIGIIEFLLKNGARINCKDKNNNTPLHNAAKTGNLYVVKFLLEKGANVNAVNNHGEAPVHVVANNYYAITNNNVGDIIETIRILKEKGADISKKAGLGVSTTPDIRAKFNTEKNVFADKLSRENQEKIIALFAQS